MPTGQEEDDVKAIGAVSRLRKAMAEAGLVLISTGALKEMQAFDDEVSCPYCAEWNHASVGPNESIDIACIGCGGAFGVTLVRYLVASDYPD